ncbi:MAG: methyltransferase domain-containing protein [Deltaproteobacteria bacterium]|jgi:ubiquinone/menaquinone biosynthesis C-methylase UbiE|nr:methyltransferase domain-containing protein [Deltaproteobacteria bacterium]
MEKKSGYVHGYTNRENERLVDQANALVELLHGDTVYPPGSVILEAGCGVGAQTITLAATSPRTQFFSVDISRDLLALARERVKAAHSGNVRFLQADIFDLPFGDETFDHVFVCFVLEHLPRPGEALKHLKRVLKTGGSITVIEGDHGSVYFHPESHFARKAIQCLIDLQAAAGGNSLIGRQLYPLLCESGFSNARVSPRMVYVDSSRPELVEGFTKNTFTAMVEGVQGRALAEGMIDPAAWERGVADLYRTAEPDGTFCYTFFKAVATKGISGKHHV